MPEETEKLTNAWMKFVRMFVVEPFDFCMDGISVIELEKL